MKQPMKRDDYWSDLSPADLLRFVEEQVGGSPNDPEIGPDMAAYEWRYVRAYPLAHLGGDRRAWASAWREEKKAWADDGEPRRYAALERAFARRPHDFDPVILAELPTGVKLADGWHRLAVAYGAQMAAVPAIVGRRRATAVSGHQRLFGLPRT